MNVAPFPNKRGWLERCILSDGKSPKPLPIVANALIALRNDPAVIDAFAYDEMLCAPMLMHHNRRTAQREHHRASAAHRQRCHGPPRVDAKRRSQTDRP
jgi:hypothetical protein